MYMYKNHFVCLSRYLPFKFTKNICSKYVKNFSSSQRLKMPSDMCYYKLLNITPNASFDEIKKEYYKLAKKYHPDNKDNSSANQIV
jgi:hypothetical protein